MSFLGMKDRDVLVLGVGNKKSVGFVTARALLREGARVWCGVHSAARAEELKKTLPEGRALVCDVRSEAAVDGLCDALAAEDVRLSGVVHSIAHANYHPDRPRFLDVVRQDFLDAMQVSCHSLVEVCARLESRLLDGASVVALSISSTELAAENYGYMAPVKAALNTTVIFLAKSLSARGVRVNALCAGPLKTRASAGIPGYAKSYLYAEQATLRKQGVSTAEVADTALFLLSERSSGINAQRIVVDAGMGVNYFDAAIVDRVTAVD